MRRYSSRDYAMPRTSECQDGTLSFLPSFRPSPGPLVSSRVVPSESNSITQSSTVVDFYRGYARRPGKMSLKREQLKYRPCLLLVSSIGQSSRSMLQRGTLQQEPLVSTRPLASGLRSPTPPRTT